MQQDTSISDGSHALTSGIKHYPCPRCKKLTSFEGNPNKPFCSERCKLIDLGAWASQDYKIEAKNDSLFPDEH